MNSGFITNEQKLHLQERTSVLANTAGIQIQSLDGSGANGVSTKRFYKILANVIWDWHTLCHTGGYGDIRGIGDFMWVPHRFGALGYVAPKVGYLNVKRYNNHFADICDLFKCGLYSQFAFRGIREEKGERYLQFGLQPLELSEVKKHPVAFEEFYYWQSLVTCYASHTTETLNACASCRNEGAAYLSILIQFLVWRKNMDAVMSRLASGADISEIGLLGRMEAAIQCAEQARVKAGYYLERDKYINRIRDESRYSQFSNIVPFIDIPEEWMSTRIGLLERLIEVLPVLEALHGVMGAVWSVLSVDLNQLKQSRSELETSCSLLVQILPEISRDINIHQWCILCIQRDAKRLGILGRELIIKVYGLLRDRTGIEFRDVQSYYNDLIDDYPLPTENFKPGF